MKTKSLLLPFFAVCFLYACKKESDKPQTSIAPVFEISFGQFKSLIDFVPYPNQNGIHPDVATLKDFGIRIIEYKVPNGANLSSDSLVFEFDVETKYDHEHYQTGKNMSSFYTSSYNGTIEGGFPLYLNLTSSPIKNNSSLDINASGDFIKITYLSHHSTVIGSDSIQINP